MSRLLYVSHPEVDVDPNIAVPDWALSETGRRRVHTLLDQPWLTRASSLASSPETKALETATIIADHTGLAVDVFDDSHEIDRSATGFVPHARHEQLADRLFADPLASADGWERAADAQRRIVTRFEPLLSPGGDTTQIAIGHGGVGTLLLCHLLGVDINRSHDQPGQGHYWSFDCERQRVVHRWRPIDRIEPTITEGAPTRDDVVQLLQSHGEFAHAHSPVDHVHALDLAGLTSSDITFCTARRGNELIGVGALRDLGSGRSEIKSMHTVLAARGEGVARFMLQHLVDLARSRGTTWIGLETGTMEAFTPARRLYKSFGFEPCEPFGQYSDNQFSICMSLPLVA